MRLLATLQRYEYRTDLQKNAHKTTKSRLKTIKWHKIHKKMQLKFADLEIMSTFAIPNEKNGTRSLKGSIAQLV